MKIKEYINNLEENEDINNILTNIKFFQHERLLHFEALFLTGIYMLTFFISFIVLENILLFILFLITLVLFIPYIFYYYHLENNIHKLYKIYNKRATSK